MMTERLPALTREARKDANALIERALAGERSPGLLRELEWSEVRLLGLETLMRSAHGQV